MAQIIKIKRSNSTATPSSLSAGELAYSETSQKLFIGRPNDGAVIDIGGELYTDMLDHTAGTLTADSAIVVDSSSKVNRLLTGDIRINNTTNQIDTASGNLILDPAGTLDINSGTIDLETQATEFKLIDNSATAGTFATGDHTYLTFDTTNSAELVKFGRQVELSGAYTLPTTDGTIGQALVTDGAGVVTFTDVAATLTVDVTDDSSTADVELLTDDLQFTGGEGIDLTVAKVGTDITVTIDGEDASASNKGVASFNSTNFTVTSGAVASNDVTLTSDTGSAAATLGETFTISGGEGIDTTATGTTLTITGEDASDTNKGVASFNATNFTASSGAISANDVTLSSDSGSAAATIGETFTIAGGEGIDTSATGTTLTIIGENATSSNKGVASFDSTDFTVTSGAVTANAITLGSSSLNLGETTTDIAGLTSVAIDNITVNGNEISSTNTNGDISLNPNGSGVVDVNNSRITNITDPTQAQDAATKGYVDAVKQALDIKDSVRVATTANITIADDLNVGDTIDGVTLADGDRVLVKNQTDASQNGIYVAGSSPVRAADANISAEVTAGLFVFVEEGTIGGDNGFVLTTNDPITLDTTDLEFAQFSGAGQVIAGEGLSKSGNTLNVNDDNITLEVNSDNLRIKGITTTAIGDLLIGAATNGGYNRLVKPSSGDVTAHDYILSMNTSGAAQWSNTLDGGTF